MAREPSKAANSEVSLADIISDLQVLSTSCESDIDSDYPWNIPYLRDEFSRILGQLKQLRPEKCNDVSDIKVDAHVLGEIARGESDTRTYSYLRTIYAETSKLLGRLGGEKTTKQTEIKPLGNKVFIVHGRDEGVKQAVARFLEKLDLDVIILHEQANKGKTVMEKLETHSSEVDIDYAVVILTPDDVGKLGSGAGQLYPRARQNVVFELGYFIGRLGRERTCALKQGEIEIPTDYEGVLYIPLDANNAWQLKLAMELKAVGFDIDLNKLAEKTK